MSDVLSCDQVRPRSRASGGNAITFWAGLGAFGSTTQRTLETTLGFPVEARYRPVRSQASVPFSYEIIGDDVMGSGSPFPFTNATRLVVGLFGAEGILST